MRKLVVAWLLAGASIVAGGSAASACDCYGYNAGYYGYAAPRVYAYAPPRPAYAYAPAPRVYAYAPARRVYAYAPATRVYAYAAAPWVYAYAPAAPVYAYEPVTSVYYDPVWGWTSW
jgi:hypothetical protein